jgi:hypothetical protein
MTMTSVQISEATRTGTGYRPSSVCLDLDSGDLVAYVDTRRDSATAPWRHELELPIPPLPAAAINELLAGVAPHAQILLDSYAGAWNGIPRCLDPDDTAAVSAWAAIAALVSAA